MSAITIKNIPEDIHKGLRVRAQLHHRSINGEVLVLLREAVSRPPARDRMKRFLDTVDRMRKKHRIVATDEEINRYKRAGLA